MCGTGKERQLTLEYRTHLHRLLLGLLRLWTRKMKIYRLMEIADPAIEMIGVDAKTKMLGERTSMIIALCKKKGVPEAIHGAKMLRPLIIGRNSLLKDRPQQGVLPDLHIKCINEGDDILFTPDICL